LFGFFDQLTSLGNEQLLTRAQRSVLLPEPLVQADQGRQPKLKLIEVKLGQSPRLHWNSAHYRRGFAGGQSGRCACYDLGSSSKAQAYLLWREVATDIIDPDIGPYLDAGPLNPSPSEAHGILCGLICGGDASALESWLDQVAPTADAGETLVVEGRAALREYGLTIEREFKTSEPLVELPSPGESAPLGERALWLYDWVRGFLYALALLSLPESELSEQGREILRDLTAITQMDLDELEDSEENEQALAEVSEFIRVAAMLIHHERAVARSETRAEPASASPADRETNPE
jgi:uncharacterized protein